MTGAWTIYDSPLGPLTLHGGPAGLTRVCFPGRTDPLDESRRDPAALASALTQLDEYFVGERQTFELTFDLAGTPFQRHVWEALQRIPYGSTTSYGELARTIGRLDRVRAVGAAVGRTPIPIIIPCHRVIGADGSLTGYGGGLHRKQALLDHEAAHATGEDPAAHWRVRQLALL
jgi:methylated-DNA-[protein]-cysteine S-methyltransferase